MSIFIKDIAVNLIKHSNTENSYVKVSDTNNLLVWSKKDIARQSFQYLRLKILSNQSGSNDFVSLGELIVRDTTSSPLVPQSITSNIASFESGYSNFNSLNDRDFSSGIKFRITGYPVFLTLDFNQVVEANTILISGSPVSTEMNFSIKSFEIEKSEDGISWISLGNFLIENWSFGQERELPL